MKVISIRMIGAALAITFLASACGRSAPEDVAADVDTADEPSSAGIQVTSEVPVVAPIATSTTATTAAPAPTLQQGGTYIVEPGDTLSVIAEQFQVTVEALSQANNITNVDSIRPGQELIIPPAQG